MTVDDANGDERLARAADDPPATASEAPSSVPGVAHELAPAEGPAAGPPATDRSASVQEAWLDLEDFLRQRAGDTPGPAADPAVGPGPADDASPLPGDAPSDSSSASGDAPTLATGAGLQPSSGGIGDYVEPSAGDVWHGLRAADPATDTPSRLAGPSGDSTAFGPAWTAGAVPPPAAPAPIAYTEITGTAANNRLNGTADHDHIVGLAGNDRLYGGDRADWLEGGDGNDRLYGDGGADRLEGGAGNDTLYIDSADSWVDGGAGTDRVYVQGAAGVALNLTAAQVEYAQGGAGNDVFNAGGSTVAVTLYGEAGDDRLTGGDANDRIYGQADNDRMAGGGGNDTLYGGDGNDRIEGGDGNDRLYGEDGADQLLGGDGNDRLYIDADDTLVDGGDGTDTVYVQTDVGVDLAASHVEIAYGKGGDDSFDGSAAADAVRLDGKGGDDTLLGGAGDDLLYGRDGADSLSGGAGNDRLWGHEGDDVLLGGAGNDRLSGGDGDDSFVFELSFTGGGSIVSGPGADRVLDFDTASGDTLVFADVIDVNGDTHVDLNDLFALEADGRLDVFESGSRVVMDFNGGGSITLDGLATGGIDTLQDAIDAGINVAV